MKPNERRDRILDILYSRGKVHAKELASELDAGVKAIYSDLDYLSDYYVIERIRGRNGGYRLISPRIDGRYVLSKSEMDFLEGLGKRGNLDENEKLRLKIIMKKLYDQALYLKLSKEADDAGR